MTVKNSEAQQKMIILYYFFYRFINDEVVSKTLLGEYRAKITVKLVILLYTIFKH